MGIEKYFPIFMFRPVNLVKFEKEQDNLWSCA